MHNIEVGENAVLLMDIADTETPFFSYVGRMYPVQDIRVDPSMPSGYAVVIRTHGRNVLVDKSAVVHEEDWKRIYKSVTKDIAGKVDSLAYS